MEHEANENTANILKQDGNEFSEYCRLIQQDLSAEFGEELKLQEVTRSDGETYTALVGPRHELPDDSATCALINMNDILAWATDNGKDVEEIKDECRRIFKESVPPTGILKLLKDYNKAKERLSIRFVNEKNLNNSLASRPVISDIHMIFSVEAGKISNGSATASVAVTENMLEQWDVDVEKLYADALSSSRKMLPPRVELMGNILRCMAGEMDLPDAGNNELTVVTNLYGQYGASVLLYPEILEQLEGVYYVLPSSVHETILLRAAKDTDVRELREIVRTVNKTECKAQEFLSNEVFLFDASTGILSVAEPEPIETSD